MACAPEELKHVPLFELLDDDETAILAAQVEVREFAARQRIYKIGDVDGKAYVVMSGTVRVTMVDEDQQEVVIDEAGHGEFFGFASMLEGVPHMTNAMALEGAVCLEVDRHDIEVLLTRKPMAGMDMLTVQSRQIHAGQALVRLRGNRNANDMIDEEMSLGQRIADHVAQFGGSWTFIILFGAVLVVYTAVNVVLSHDGPQPNGKAWDPYPFILLNLFLSMLAAIQAPVIMMSQNRQDTKDRVRSELDYEVNRRAESEIQALAGKVHLLTEKIDDMDDLLRKRQDTV
jgi:CRP/FNR family transcriptional regulator, cyclic AMP receptor protein